MTVNGDDGIFNAWCMFFDVTDFITKLIRVHVTYCIWYVNNRCTTSNGNTKYLAREI